MKILFSADWHIKLGQKNVPREWAKNRYNMLFEQLYTYEAEADLHIIGGDLFDRLPSLEELALAANYLSNVQCPVVVFPGNHEATKKNETFMETIQDLFSFPNVTFVNQPTEYGEYGILPYNYLHRDPKLWPNTEYLFTHVRGEIPPHVKPEVDLSLFDRYKTVFAGDLHSHSNSQRNIIYPGSPVTTSFHRSKVDTGVITIEDDWSWNWHKLNVPQLIRKTVSSEEEMVKTEFDHTVYELEGDLQELATAKNELLDKKIVRRNTEASLVLTRDMSLEEELSEYFRYILELPESTTERLLKRYADIKGSSVG